jgi:AcrR family transcriptional regulator
MANYSPEMPQRLAQSAFKLFSQQGFKRVNVEQVAADLGLTKGSVYWHYRSKKELIKAACAHYYRTYQRRINEEIAAVADPRERLERTLRLAVRTCLMDEENRIFTMEIFTTALHDAEVRRSWQQFYDSVREFYLGLVKAASAAGQIRIEDPEQSVNTMLSTMEGIKLRALFEPQICALEEERKILRGLQQILGFEVTAAEKLNT